ncbi:MAG TPA: hypothetical protein VE401_02010 [Solirubrobacterales bacterium]|nr:hypothetical protein [Solirubrobacterales bacterium]
MTRYRLLSLAVVALLGTGLLAGCGGDDGGDEDPEAVLDETFSNDESINSGVLDLSLDISAEGDEGGSFDASLSGPFQGEEAEQGEFPQFDLTASLSGQGGGQSIDFDGGLIATSDQAFVSYQDTDYEVPQAFFNQIKRLSEQAAAQPETEGQDTGAILEQLGIDPSTWLTNVENEGDEEVEGTDTTHIHGDANVAAVLEDFQSAAERTGAGTTQQIDPDEIAEVEDAIDEASIDVYSGVDDRILRRLDFNLAISPPEDDASGVDSADVGFSLTFSDVNQDQTIEAPSDAQPFSQLEQDVGLPPGLLEGALGGGGGGGGGLPGGGGGGLPDGGGGGGGLLPGGGGGGGGGLPGGGGGGGGSGGGGGLPGDGATDAYFKCLQDAQSQEDITACASEL